MITTKIIIRTIELVPATITTVETIDQSQLNFDRTQNYYSSLYHHRGNQQVKNLITWISWFRTMRHFFKPPRLKGILWSNKIPIEWRKKCQTLFYSKPLRLLFHLDDVQQIFVVYQHCCVVVVSFNFKYFLCSIKWINDSLVRHWDRNLFNKVFVLHVCGGNYFAGKYSLAMTKFSSYTVDRKGIYIHSTYIHNKFTSFFVCVSMELFFCFLQNKSWGTRRRRRWMILLFECGFGVCF